ncbi:MAG TPA: SLATT domain-containing protein [Bryobacteraceae bacterium]|nr:SLATT domain-containing protein [Bryobacteraceae bacterium]
MATPPDVLSNLSWKDSDMEASLAALRRYVESEAQKQIDWYYAKKTVKSRVSTGLRFLAILLFVTGGLVPIIKATLPTTAVNKFPFDFGQAGYLLIGIAAGCLGLDRFFGYSTGWIRYITTAMAIEKSLEEYRMEWARNMAKLRGGPPNEQQLDQLIQTCEAFSLAIKSQVEQETKAWVAEFQSSLSQLEKDLQAKAEEVKSKTMQQDGTTPQAQA